MQLTLDIVVGTDRLSVDRPVVGRPDRRLHPRLLHVPHQRMKVIRGVVLQDAEGLVDVLRRKEGQGQQLPHELVRASLLPVLGREAQILQE